MRRKKSEVSEEPPIIEVKEVEVAEKEVDLEKSEKEDSLAPLDRGSFAYLNRSSFITVANNLLESANRLSAGLSFMDAILMDPDVFEEADLATQTNIHKAISQRAATTFSDIHRILDLAVKSDFNRNFLGIQAEMGKVKEDSEEEGREMSTEVRVALSSINAILHRKLTGE